MSYLDKSIPHMAVILTLVLASASAHADAVSGGDAQITKTAVQTEIGQQIPAGAFGIVEIKRPREATLLNLRGMAGRGDVVLRGNESGTCVTFQLRLVAGDFGGDNISSHITGPILLVLHSKGVAGALASGDDVVSDMYRVSTDDSAGIDISIKTGLSAEHGFVLNPGRSIIADIFGADMRQIACLPV